MDKHNSKRQGGASFEDTWKTHKWWLRDFQMLFGISEVNAYLLFTKFKAANMSMEHFRRVLVHQILHHPLVMMEREQGVITRALSARSERTGGHILQMCSDKVPGKMYNFQGCCVFCKMKVSTFCGCGASPDLSKTSHKRCRDTVFVCSAVTKRDCFERHLRGEVALNAKSEAAKRRWKKQRTSTGTQQEGPVA